MGDDASGSAEGQGSEDYNAGDYNAGDAGAEEYNEEYAWEPPPPSGLEQLEKALSTVSEPIVSVARQAGEAFQSVLEHPSLLALLPGGSLTLLGVGLVLLSLLLSAVPVIHGIGRFGGGVMFLMGLWVAINEWRLRSGPEAEDAGYTPMRPMPAALESLPADTQHPVIGYVFALLTCTHALLMFGWPISLLWMLAALVLGYDQGRRYFAQSPEDAAELEAGAHGLRLHRWVVVGVVICSFSLLFSWTRGTLQVPATSGAEQPLSTLTQGTLLLLACSAVRHRGLSALHPLGLILMGVWLTLWFFLMMNVYTVGSWLFLPGLLLLDAVIVFHFLPKRRGGDDAYAEQDAASDMDMQG
ncbi:hypothetical protein [Archangium sp.]|uniref:hypothetical protein n=1 Tax=Archangium sp. TaxID=1872627 RepID=UPI0038998A3F